MRRLKAAREERDIDQKEVAREVGVAPGTVSRWESGESVPTGTGLIRLAQYFDTTERWIYEYASRAISILRSRRPLELYTTRAQ